MIKHKCFSVALIAFLLLTCFASLCGVVPYAKAAPEDELGNGTFGGAWTNGSPEDMVDLIADAGGQHIIMWCGDETLDYNTMFGWENEYDGDTYNYTQFLTRIRAEATVKGIKLGLQWVIDTETKQDIINDVDGKQTTYINLYKTIVTKFQPDFVDVLNEVLGTLEYEYGTEGFLANYTAFVEDCIDELRSVSDLGENLTAVVSSVPFWDLAYVTANPVAKDNCVYAVHSYYTWDNEYPPVWDEWKVAYWDAVTEQDFIDAKALLEYDLFTTYGITAAETAGLTIFVEETGCNTLTPNYLRAMDDFWDICVDNDLQFSTQNAPYAYYIPLFNSAGDLTSLGEVWTWHLDTSPTPTPTPTATPTPQNVPTVDITKPQARAYTSGSFNISITSTNSLLTWYNIKNGTSWVYSGNVTYTSETTLTGFDSGYYTCYAWAVNNGTSNQSLIAQDTVVFSVSVDGTLPAINMDAFWLFLYEGNFLGMVQSYLTTSFLNLQTAIALVAMLFLVPLYLRTKSLMLICVLWILLGGFFIAALPMASGIAVLFMTLGIGGMVWRLFRGTTYG